MLSVRVAELKVPVRSTGAFACGGFVDQMVNNPGPEPCQKHNATLPKNSYVKVVLPHPAILNVNTVCVHLEIGLTYQRRAAIIDQT